MKQFDARDLSARFQVQLAAVDFSPLAKKKKHRESTAIRRTGVHPYPVSDGHCNKCFAFACASALSQTFAGRSERRKKRKEK